MDNVNEALIEYKKAITMNPKDGSFYLQRAQVYSRLENYESALDDYTLSLGFLKDVSQIFKAKFHRGDCYRQVKDFANSIKDLEEVINIK